MRPGRSTYFGKLETHKELLPWAKQNVECKAEDEAVVGLRKGIL